ncbi:MAG: hypothetical protein EOO77_21610 [Oxalobacteraceae bacterium]|nr:MAG: hypothetical protein EOO77_21610 [Oxalobacteraceae bacterium]
MAPVVPTLAFILAAAGLLGGRRATTHWEVWQDLKLRYPATTVEPDASIGLKLLLKLIGPLAPDSML